MTSTGSRSFTTRSFNAGAGSGVQVCVAAGTVIQVTQGRLRLTQPPRWLAETMVWLDLPLSEGQAHEVAQAGWSTLQATDEGGAHWLLHEPVLVSARSRAIHLWHTLAQAIRRTGRYGAGGAMRARSTARRSRLSEGQISEAL